MYNTFVVRIPRALEYNAFGVKTEKTHKHMQKSIHTCRITIALNTSEYGKSVILKDVKSPDLGRPSYKSRARVFRKLLLRWYAFCAAILITVTPGGGAEREPFTIVVLPDTQFYSEKYPEIFQAQTEWIRERCEADNIKFVMHLGDITQHNSPDQWESSQSAMRVLDGHVPYSLCVGNHDMGPGGSTGDRSSLFDKYFSTSHYESRSWYGGHMGQTNRAHYCLFEAAGMDFMVISIEYGPTDDILDWANDIIGQHADRRVIVLTHAYMFSDNTRLSRTDRSNPHLETFGPTNDGDDMWEKFVRKHRNIFLVVSGHIDCDHYSYLTSTGDQGNQVHQLLTNYQHMERGGNGYLVLMRFAPRENKIHLRTYSPVLGEFLAAPGNKLELKYEMR